MHMNILTWFIQREIATPNFDEDDESVEKDDEKPVIVVLKDGDLTAAEAEQATKDKGAHLSFRYSGTTF